MQAPHTTIVLTFLNEGESLRALLDAILDQSLPPEEVVVVDGGSSDQTVDILNEYAAEDDRFRILIEPGVNIAIGRNIAISHAKNHIIAVTDGGCRPDHRWLEELIKPLQGQSEYEASAGQVIADPQSRFEYYSGLLCLPKDSGDSLTRQFYGRSSAFNRQAWLEVGGYPEWLYTAEDTLFALRFNQLGKRVAYSCDSKVYWRPRRNLYRLGKMFFLYGVGNGRINRGRLRESFYWLRFHAIWLGSVVAGLYFPWILAIGLADIAYLYFLLAHPALTAVRAKSNDPLREVYVPFIVFIRSFATHAGFLLGHWEFMRKPLYRKRLEIYQR